MIDVELPPPGPSRSGSVAELDEASTLIISRISATLADRRSRATRARTRKKRVRTWLSAEQELEMVIEERGADSWQARLVSKAQSHSVQMFLIGLLILDVVVVFVELFLDAEFPRCAIVVRDATSCCAAAADDHHRLLGSASHQLCAAPYADATSAPACDAHQHEGVHAVHGWLFGSSIAILGLFAVELCALVAAMGPRFFQHPAYLLDFIVVFVSLGLEVGLHLALGDAGDDAGAGLGGVLVLARVWRFARIAHGVMTSTHEVDEMGHEEEHLAESIAKLEQHHKSLVHRARAAESAAAAQTAQSSG